MPLGKFFEMLVPAKHEIVHGVSGLSSNNFTQIDKRKPHHLEHVAMVMSNQIRTRLV